MLSREQVNAMLMIRNRKNTILSEFPVDLIREIRGWATNDVAKALQYAAYARKEDVEALTKMLDADPSLLIDRGNVKTPGGDEIRNVTIYELVLGAGDYELAKMIQPYFSEIEGGEEQMKCQYESYRPHIEGMLEQKPYDLTKLIDLIKKASALDVRALLNKDMTRESDLCNAIIQFRKDWAPRVITRPCMHYNYASLQHAFELLERNWDDLYKESRRSYGKICLVWQQLIGFEMRRLPGIDRCVMAQGLYYVTKNQQLVVRSYKLKGRAKDLAEDFPVITVDDSLAGLGGDFSVDIFGEATRLGGALRPGGVALKTYVQEKLQTCRAYAPTTSLSTDWMSNSLK